MTAVVSFRHAARSGDGIRRKQIEGLEVSEIRGDLPNSLGHSFPCRNRMLKSA
jgi:hypothetical protein